MGDVGHFIPLLLLLLLLLLPPPPPQPNSQPLKLPLPLHSHVTSPCPKQTLPPTALTMRPRPWSMALELMVGLLLMVQA